MNRTKSSYKWVMFVLAMILCLVLGLMMLLPAPLITTIMADTGWDVGAAGSLLSIISLLNGVFVFLGSPLMEKLGVKKTAVLGMIICAVGGLLPFVAGTSYALHYLGRLLYGVGFGMLFNVAPVVITTWFAPELQSTLQGVRMAIAYGGFALVYYIVIAIYNGTGSWQSTFGVFGVLCAIIALLWLFFGKDAPAMAPPEVSDKPQAKEKSGLLQAVRSKDVWMLAVALLCMIWVFNTLNSYLPTYLELERGMTATDASSVTGLMMIGGIFGGLICGVLGSVLGRRKIFGWPLFLITLLGMLITLNADGFFMGFGIFIAGFSACGFTMMYSVMPAEFPYSTPAFYGGAMALIVGFAYIPAYFMPNVFSAMYAGGMSIQSIFMIFGALLLVGAIPLAIIKETGPKGKARLAAAKTKQ